MAKKKDATHDKGVSDENKDLQPDTQDETEPETIETEEEKKTVEDRMSERDQLVEDMAARIEKEREEEAGITGKEAKDVSEKDEPGEEKEKVGEEDEESSEKEKGTGEEETREIIVDGKKQIVPLSEIIDAGIRTKQKETAADKRLEEAVKLLKEAKEVASGKKDTDTTDDDKDKTAEQDFQDLSKGIDKKKIAEIREAIQYGDEEEADKAFEELIGLVSTTSKIPENIMTIEDYEKKESEKQQKDILDKFNLPPEDGGFKDIMDDPYLLAAVKIEVDKELAEGTPNNWELYKSAGDKVRKWRGTPKDANTQKKDADQKAKDDLAEKREKKAKAAGATLKGVNAKTETTLKAEDKEESPADIVKQMKKERGQLV